MSAETGDGQAPSSADAFDEIYRRIVEGIYAPGDRLVEQRIAEDLHSSRTPVREAIRRLQAAGLVVSTRNRGAVVRQLSRNEIIDLYALRSRLEAFATELAAHRGTEEDLGDIADAVDQFEAAVAAPELTSDALRAVHAANRRFHHCILETARHTMLSQMLTTTVDASLVFQSFAKFTTEDFENSKLFHRLIFNALLTKQPGRAGRLMREHIDQGRDVLLRELDDTDDGDYAAHFRVRLDLVDLHNRRAVGAGDPDGSET